MNNEDLLGLLEDGLRESVKMLVEKVKAGTASASDVSQLRSMAKELGIELSAHGKPTPVGDDVLASMQDVDRDLLAH